MEETDRTESQAPGPAPPGPEPIEPARSARWKRIFNGIILLIVVLVALQGPILRAIGQGLVRQDPPEKADLIVLLAGSPVARSLAAADYYKQGLAPRIFMSRGYLAGADLVDDLDLSDTGEWGLTYRILTAKGVPSEAIIRDPVFVDSTVSEARRFRAWMAERPARSIILVTSRFHSARAWMVFTRVLGPEVRVISLPSRYDPFDPDAWWEDRAQAKAVVLEYQKWPVSWFESGPD
ncbi:MAG: YdcF family protein [Proteobacteria bacterium]|nr:YdcF family protein [Pseudomonadota bacterium]